MANESGLIHYCPNYRILKVKPVIPGGQQVIAISDDCGVRIVLSFTNGKHLSDRGKYLLI